MKQVVLTILCLFVFFCLYKGGEHLYLYDLYDGRVNVYYGTEKKDELSELPEGFKIGYNDCLKTYSPMTLIDGKWRFVWIPHYSPPDWHYLPIHKLSDSLIAKRFIFYYYRYEHKKSSCDEIQFK